MVKENELWRIPSVHVMVYREYPECTGVTSVNCVAVANLTELTLKNVPQVVNVQELKDNGASMPVSTDAGSVPFQNRLLMCVTIRSLSVPPDVRQRFYSKVIK